jgi:hypothetical protein
MAYFVPGILETQVARLRTILSFLLLVGLPSHGFATNSSPSAITSPADAWSFADLSDLFLGSPVVLTARVVDAVPIAESAAASPRAGTKRYYVVADVVTLIRGTGGVAPRVAWLADVPVDGRGKAPRLKKTLVVVAALPVAGRAGELRLAALDAMVPWSSALEDRVRAVVASGLAADAPPAVTGIAGAFHSNGTLPGEGETQIFLSTADARPVSLNILRRPGQEVRWSVAFTEIVDEAAGVPARDTLGWYRLACSLPATLPETATGELSAEDAASARADYAFVIGSLGQCERVRAAR